jgi:hypothetical protein
VLYSCSITPVFRLTPVFGCRSATVWESTAFRNFLHVGCKKSLQSATSSWFLLLLPATGRAVLISQAAELIDASLGHYSLSNAEARTTISSC